jgi:MFS superfamily sulfate permease-like transporter
LGVLPGVLLAVALSLIWLLYVGSRPNDAVLGRVAGRKGFHSVTDYPDAKTLPGLLLYRFDANIVFYNADHFKARVKAAIAAQRTPVEWIVIDASPVNVVDVTGLRKLDELRAELAQEGVSLYFARVKRHLESFFNADYAKERRKAAKKYRFQTLKPAVNAFIKQQQDKGRVLDDTYTDEQTSVSPQWRETAQLPRREESGTVPLPPEP